MESIILHQKVSKSEARQRAIDLYREVGILSERRIDSYPTKCRGARNNRS